VQVGTERADFALRSFDRLRGCDDRLGVRGSTAVAGLAAGNGGDRSPRLLRRSRTTAARALSNLARQYLAARDRARILECEAEYDPASLQAPGRSSLSEKEFAPDLEVLARQGVYVSNDTPSDPNLEPMRASYLLPGLVEALMDGAITINGVVVGVVCCEEVGRRRIWLQIKVTAMMRSIATVNVHLARLQGDDDRAGLPFSV